LSKSDCSERVYVKQGVRGSTPIPFLQNSSTTGENCQVPLDIIARCHIIARQKFQVPQLQGATIPQLHRYHKVPQLLGATIARCHNSTIAQVPQVATIARCQVPHLPDPSCHLLVAKCHICTAPQKVPQLPGATIPQLHRCHEVPQLQGARCHICQIPGARCQVPQVPHVYRRHNCTGATIVGLARTVYIHRIWLYIRWFPCQKYRIYTVYIYIYIYIYIYMVLANPTQLAGGHLTLPLLYLVFWWIYLWLAEINQQPTNQTT